MSMLRFYTRIISDSPATVKPRISLLYSVPPRTPLKPPPPPPPRGPPPYMLKARQINLIYKTRATPKIPANPANPAAITPSSLSAPPVAAFDVEAAAAELCPAAAAPLVELPPVGVATVPELVFVAVVIEVIGIELAVEFPVAVALTLASPELSAAAPASSPTHPE